MTRSTLRASSREKLALDGLRVTFVTPASVVSPFTELTLEQERVQARLIELGVAILCRQRLVAVGGGRMRLACAYTGREDDIACDAAVLTTERIRETALHDALAQAGGLETLELIGDAAAPGLIADAVFSGHLAARNFERDPADIEREWFRRESASAPLPGADRP